MLTYAEPEVQEVPGGIVLNGFDDFDAEQTFECGQCFRWSREPGGTYAGVAGGKLLRIKKVGDKTYFLETTREQWESFWKNYLDVSTDYSKIKEFLSSDPIMKKAISYGAGIRLLRQDFWEVLISFILSANNNIPRIKKIIAGLSEMFGEPIPDTQYYSFPKPEALYNSDMDRIQLCRAGYRCRYIKEAAAFVVEGRLVPEKLKDMPEEEIRRRLMEVTGVGEKVADCIMLYSGLSRKAFPIDVWIKRIMEELYFHRTATPREIREFAAERFGEHAGIAQQYLYYYARENL